MVAVVVVLLLLLLKPTRAVGHGGHGLQDQKSAEECGSTSAT